MTTTKTLEEDKLLLAARLLNEDELKVLLNFVNHFVHKKERKEPTISDKKKFLDFVEILRDKAAEKGLTPEILEEILAEDE
ncbi:MAG: hypothetical protein JWQ09_4364 [Segetibacter sp.]|nr:hypothetical protein [Segetibacter sp.]